MGFQTMMKIVGRMRALKMMEALMTPRMTNTNKRILIIFNKKVLTIMVSTILQGNLLNPKLLHKSLICLLKLKFKKSLNLSKN